MPARSLSRVSQADKLQLNPVQVDVDVRGVLSFKNGGTGLDTVGDQDQVLTIIDGAPSWEDSSGSGDSANASIVSQVVS